MSSSQLEWSAQKLMAASGTLARTSNWIDIAQSRINQFADATDDHQFIHVDLERTRAETEYDGTIAHGFLSLSMLSTMIARTLPRVENAVMSLNYGFEKIRFLNPVASGARIRGHFVLEECQLRKPNELLSRYGVTVEIENIEKPALIAQWLGLAILKDEIS